MAAMGAELKSIEEATDIRHKILYAFEEQRWQNPADAKAWLTFVIVGAGATGMELAGALAEIANESLKNDFRHIDPRDARIILVRAASECCLLILKISPRKRKSW